MAKLIKVDEMIMGGVKVIILGDAQTKGHNFAMAIWNTK